MRWLRQVKEWPWSGIGRGVEIAGIILGVIVAFAATRTSQEARDTANAAKESSDTMKKSYDLATKSYNTAQKHADAAKESASAAKASADSVKSQVAVAREANAIAARAKDAAEKSAIAASESNRFAQAANAIAEKTADNAKADNQTSLRAYVSVGGVSIDYSDTRAEATVFFKNTGRTFAHNLTADAGMTCTTTPSSVTLITPTVQPTPRSLGPSGSVRVVLVAKLPRGWATATGEMQSWIAGRITYKDQFGVDRYTNFQFVQDDTRARNGRFGVIYDKEGNDAN